MDPVLLIAPGLMVLMGVVSLVGGLPEGAWWSGFRERVVRLPGQVTGVRTRRRRTRVGVYFSYCPRIAFVLPDGTGSQAWARYRLPFPPAPGSALDVLVDPAGPDRVMVADGPEASTTAPLIVGAFLIAGGLGALAAFSALLR